MLPENSGKEFKQLHWEQQQQKLKRKIFETKMLHEVEDRLK